jgi:hypothetical protein
MEQQLKSNKNKRPSLLYRKKKRKEKMSTDRYDCSGFHPTTLASTTTSSGESQKEKKLY